MARDLDIFVNSDLEIKNFLQEMQAILDISLSPISDEPWTYYEYWDPPLYLTVREHTLENNLGIEFEDCKYVIGVSAVRIYKADERIRLQDELGEMVFDKLKVTKKYKLLLVDDLQHKGAEYDPDSAEQKTDNSTNTEEN